MKLYLFFLTALFSFHANASVDDTIEFLRKSIHPNYRLQDKDIKFAKSSIEKGLELIPVIISNEYNKDKKSDILKLKDVLSFCWGLFHLTTEKGFGFDQGMLVVEDRDGLIFDFLSHSGWSYQRISSHYEFLNKKLKSNQYGIDFLGNMTEDGDWIVEKSKNKYSHFLNMGLSPLPLLPAKKSHILFGQLSKGSMLELKSSYTFIRFEDYGLSTVNNLFEHMKDYISIHTNTLYQDRVVTGYRVNSERVSAELVDLYIKLLQKNKHLLESPISINEEKQKCFDLGIRYIYSKTVSLSSILSVSESSHDLIERIFLYFKYLDELEARTGWEAVLSYEDLIL